MRALALLLPLALGLTACGQSDDGGIEVAVLGEPAELFALGNRLAPPGDGGGPTPPPGPSTEVLAGVYLPAAGTSLGIGECTGLTLLSQVAVGCDSGPGQGAAEVRLGDARIRL
mgnify:CR=1 FL=1